MSDCSPHEIVRASGTLPLASACHSEAEILGIFKSPSAAPEVPSSSPLARRRIRCSRSESSALALYHYASRRTVELARVESKAIVCVHHLFLSKAKCSRNSSKAS
jgi:dihydroorotase-like cyclic amidohydrolase